MYTICKHKGGPASLSCDMGGGEKAWPLWPPSPHSYASVFRIKGSLYVCLNGIHNLHSYIPSIHTYPTFIHTLHSYIPSIHTYPPFIHTLHSYIPSIHTYPPFIHTLHSYIPSIHTYPHINWISWNIWHPVAFELHDVKNVRHRAVHLLIVTIIA